MLVCRQLRNTEIIFNSSAATSGNYVGWNLSTDGKCSPDAGNTNKDYYSDVAVEVSVSI